MKRKEENKKRAGKTSIGLVALIVVLIALAITGCGGEEQTTGEYDTMTDSSIGESDYEYADYESGITAGDTEYVSETDYSDSLSEEEEKEDDSSIKKICYNIKNKYVKKIYCNENNESADNDGGAEKTSNGANSSVSNTNANNITNSNSNCAVTNNSNGSMDAAGSGKSIDRNTDYAEKASVRTQELEFAVGMPTTAATDATIRSKVINRRGSTITMIGCTVYDAAMHVVGTKYEPCSYSSSEFNISYNMDDDLGIVLEDGTYYYNFIAEMDGELFTNKQASFRTNGVDDTFAFEIQPVSLTKMTITTSLKIYNPNNERVGRVICKIYTPQGMLTTDSEQICDRTDSEFTVNFQFDNDGEAIPSATEYKYEFFLEHEGEKYQTSCGRFTTLP